MVLPFAVLSPPVTLQGQSVCPVVSQGVVLWGKSVGCWESPPPVVVGLPS